MPTTTKAALCIDVSGVDVEMVSALFSLIVREKCPIDITQIVVFSESETTELSVAVPLDEAMNKIFRKTSFFVLPLGLQGEEVNPKELTLYLSGFVAGRATNALYDALAQAIRTYAGPLGGLLGGGGPSQSKGVTLFVLSRRAWQPDYPIINMSAEGVRVLKTMDDVRATFSLPADTAAFPQAASDFFSRVFAGAAAARNSGGENSATDVFAQMFANNGPAANLFRASQQAASGPN